jgi:hypothetical protein
VSECGWNDLYLLWSPDKVSSSLSRGYGDTGKMIARTLCACAVLLCPKLNQAVPTVIHLRIGLLSKGSCESVLLSRTVLYRTKMLSHCKRQGVQDSRKLTRTVLYKLKLTKLRGLSPQANYTDRLSDRRLSAKLVPTLADRGCRVVSATIPTQSLISVF